MSKIIDIFLELSKTQRCSTNHNEFISFMKEKALAYNYEIFIDSVNNILCRKKDSKSQLCLQSHYDMVCLINNTIPEIYEEDGFLKAKNSTLGADNGIGCAYMLALMEEQYDLEYLFTSDEEIGLIGANGIELDIKSTYMLNLDSEEEGEICIGCAGGVDIFGKIYKKEIIPNNKNYSLYEVSINGLIGGHSGVNIHENRPNALKILGDFINESNALLLDLNGGERINSIPANAKAIIASQTFPNIKDENIKVTNLELIPEHITVLSSSIIDFIHNFENGVRELNSELEVVETSINLAICKTDINFFEIQLSARSMDNSKLNKIKDETIKDLESYGFETKSTGKYPAWKPDNNEFTKLVLDTYKKYDKDAKLKAIHAGLECAIFKDKYPSINVASLGPTINSPHSYKEKVDINSVNNVYKIVKEIINNFQ